MSADRLLNSTQDAPAWQPDHLAGFKVGDRVRLPSIEATFEVIGFQHPALLILKSPSGREVRAGWQAVTKVRTHKDIKDPTQ